MFVPSLRDDASSSPKQQTQISTTAGWNLTDLQGQLDIVQTDANAEKSKLLIFNLEERQGDHLYYWKTPAPFLGNRLNSFGSIIHYFVYYVPFESAHGHSTPIADLIIQSDQLTLEYYSRLSFFPRENISVAVPLKPSENWFDARTRRPVDKAVFMRALADVRRMLVRARYVQDQLQSSIYGFHMETAWDSAASTQIDKTSIALSPSDRKRHLVEVCTCPEHFGGNSCEQCVKGYRRVDNKLYDGTCKKCECQGHSESCDPFTGHCLICQHNTTGTRCEHCLRGFYGNPSLGTHLGQCRPCACPTVTHSRSAECTLSQLVLDGVAAAGQDDYVCTACETGYDGNKCESCADGFFGDPFADDPSNACRPCECNDNIDPAAIGNCDRRSGECLRCVGHTAGAQCEHCLPNHWGSALLHSCRLCRCHHIGALSPQCSNETGTCNCREGYTGERCNRCLLGHGDVDNACPECRCSSTGSLGIACDEVSGQCACKKGVYGKRCDLCVPSYFNFGPEGCEFCHCNQFGAIPDKECHNVTGECQCQPNVGGLKCEHCADGFFNLTSGSGCKPCGCDPQGSLEGEICDAVTGQCRCKSGVTGLKCDKCEPNHYGFDSSGCKPCRVCPAPGQVCDPTSGDCVCPPNTQGEMCERCTQNAWNATSGYHPYRGCELCQCDGVGADSQICDSRTGQCKCRAGYVGHRCDLCEPGHYSFPDCRPCECYPAGTEPSECRGSTCLCSNEGQCKCKKNVVGLKCEQCSTNAFNLEAWNPQGCIECFCSNKSTICHQSLNVWHQIYAPDRSVLFEAPFEMFDQRHSLHILKEYPSNYNSYPTNHTPLYWPLPSSFKGDKTGSYNGFLRFRIRNDYNFRGRPNVQPDPHFFRIFPQVLLVGNTRIELEHLPDKMGADEGRYKIRLHESQWRNRISPQLPVSRKQMMVALQQVQHIFVRGTYNDMHRGDSISISEVSLDISDEARGAPGETVALGVEHCEHCQKGWAGLSCQNPSAGFFRLLHVDRFDHPDDIVLMGIAQPCACHGHSDICDQETGHCHNCQHNTMGSHCEHCKDGFYGETLSASPEACRRCACPLPDNSFSHTCRHKPSAGRGYICDSCRPGYVGDYCENCESGYFGNPSIPGGFCALCACHPHGSASAICHNVTGQCLCLDGVEGRDCSVCRPRHAFLNGVCTSCDRGCHQELMLKEDAMEQSLTSLRASVVGARPIPRKRLSNLIASTQSLHSLLDGLGVGSDLSAADGLIRDELLIREELGLEGQGRPLRQALSLEQEFQLVLERNNHSLLRLNSAEQLLGDLRARVQSENKRVVDIVNRLSRFTLQSRESAPGQLNYLLSQAHAQLNSTRERDSIIEKRYNYAKTNAEEANKLLKEIVARKLNRTSYEQLAEKQRTLQTLLRDFRNTLWDEARIVGTEARNGTQFAVKELGQLEKKVGECRAVGEEAEKELARGRQMVGTIEHNTQRIHEIGKELAESLLPTLRAQREEQLATANGEMEAVVELRRKHMAEAERHAADLEQQASKLKGRFQATKFFSMDALAASNAYNSIASALRDAADAAAAAKRNAEESFELVDPQSEGSLGHLTNGSAAKSAELSAKLDSALEAIGIGERNAQQQKTLAELEDRIRMGQQNISWVRDIAQQLLEDHHDRINNIYATVNEADASISEIESAATEFNDAVSELKERTDSIQQLFTSSGIQEDIRNLTASSEEVAEVESAMEQLKERTDGQEAEFKQVSADLEVLKEKINEAREKASKIRIGVRSDQDSGCVREYISPMRPSPSNTISLKYRPAMDSPDSLILFTQVQGTRTQSSEFMAIELRQKKIHVKWDIGGGRREIFNTITGQTRISLGSSDARLTQQLDLATNRFLGTVGELEVDGISVPLWVFASSEGTCDGAAGPPFRAATGHMFRNGFAQVQMPMAERTNTMLSVQFSAYSPNGLLYMRASPSSGEFIALELNEGAVALKADFGPEAKIAIQSNGANYTDGRMHRVRVIRKDGEVHLQIDPEGDHLSITLSDSEALLNISEPDHFVGGVPPDFPRERFTQDHDIHFDGFFGCIQSVRPNPVSELDLENPERAQRKDTDCIYREERLSTMERVIGFKGLNGGFLKSRGILLDTFSTFSFNLRTRRENALLIYQSAELQRTEEAQKARRRRRRMMRKRAGSRNRRTHKRRRGAVMAEGVKGQQSFLAIYLLEGRLSIHLAPDQQHSSKRPLIVSSQPYNDGLLHSVFLSRLGKEIQVRIDDREVLATVLDDDRPIGGTDWVMMLGGLPSRLKELANRALDNELATVDPLDGCLSDFQHNYERLPILLEAHRGAILGSCPPEDGDLSNPGTAPFSSASLPDAPSSSFSSSSFSSIDSSSSSSAVEMNEQKETAGGEGRNFHHKKSRQLLEQATPRTTFAGHQLQSEAQNDHRSTQPQEFRLKPSEMAQQPPQCFGSEPAQLGGFIENGNGIHFGLCQLLRNIRNAFQNSRRRRITFDLKGHEQPKTVEYRAKRLDDGQWHRVELEKRAGQLSLGVDDMTAEKLADSPNPKVMRRRMYVGGVISKHRRIFNDQLTGEELAHAFSGCIRRFHVDGKEQNLMKHSRDLIPCADTPNVAYVHEGGHGTYESLNSHANKRGAKSVAAVADQIVEISAFFRILAERSADGGGENVGKNRLLMALLFASKDSYQTNRLLLGVNSASGALSLSIHLSKWRVHLDALFDGSPPNGSLLSSSPSSAFSVPPLTLCAGHWGQVRLRLSPTLLALSLDGQSAELPVSFPLPALDNLRSLPVHLGGTTAPVSVSLGVSSLNGCVKHFSMNGMPVNIVREKRIKAVAGRDFDFNPSSTSQTLGETKKATMFLPSSRLSSRPFLSTSLLFFLLRNVRPDIPQHNETVFAPAPPSAEPTFSFRFLHFSVWALPQWWLRSSNTSRVLAIIESFEADEMEMELELEEDEERKGRLEKETKKCWQMVLWLFTNSPEQRTPSVRLVNIGGKQIRIRSIPECWETTERGEGRRMDVEVEVSSDRLFVRAKNAVRYALPDSMDSPELRVYFIRSDQRNGQLCQLKSEVEFRETSNFNVPSTTPVLPTLRRRPPQPSPAPASPPSQILPSIVRINHKWPYSRKSSKIPRRSTKSAQRLLSPSHYVSTGPSRLFIHQKPQLLSPPFEQFGEKRQAKTTDMNTAATYIDILLDRKLYEEVQRSRTNEINSSWSTAFFVFMLLIAFLISITGVFALLVSVLLQWRPKAPKHSPHSIATIHRQKMTSKPLHFKDGMECCELQLQRVLLITSNVGSLFGENTLEVQNYWLDQIAAIVSRSNPIFIALHLQESGGKNYRQHSREMSGLVDELQKRPFLLYFLSIVELEHSIIAGGGLNENEFIRKEKFRQHFWPSFRWARKGFLHTRWKIGTRILDFINIHLFHDDSNLNFFENPTEYSGNRRKVLQYTLDKFEEFNGGTLEGDSNCFLFGDFNFRLNLASLVKKLTKQTSEREVVLQLDDNESKGRDHSVSDSSSCGGNASPNVRTDDSEDSGLARTTLSRSTSSSEAEEIRSEGVTADASRMMRRKSSVIEYFKPMTRDLLSPKDGLSRANTNWVLRIGKKRFEYFDPDWLIGEWMSYREDDCEPKLYQLKECHIDFAPTYPWSEEPNCPPKFMNTRPPAWCDRVLFNKNALRNLIQRDPKVEYASFGRERCIGDHKPVMLLFSLQ
uniref:Uncharacterized protein n=1 Tax=Globodera rostochiensis TaxID=31243 RepID=A0A914HZB5_GLORO